MASLIRKSGDDPGDVIELKPGVNRFGTGEDCDFIVDHSSVSPVHCDLVVDERGIVVRSLDNDRGTFVDEKRVTESKATVGQIIRMGEVRLMVAEDTLQTGRPHPVSAAATPTVTHCSKHPDAEVAFHCTRCDTWMCIHCVHVLKVHGGHGLCLCPECSNPCQSLIAKNTRELGQVIDQIVMVKNAFGRDFHFTPRPHAD